MLGDLSHNQTSQGAYRKPWDNQQCICLSGKAEQSREEKHPGHEYGSRERIIYFYVDNEWPYKNASYRNGNMTIKKRTNNIQISASEIMYFVYTRF